jgi:hypothetical protein
MNAQLCSLLSDPECADGLPLDYFRAMRLHDDVEFDEALDDDDVPAHELAQRTAVRA